MTTPTQARSVSSITKDRIGEDITVQLDLLRNGQLRITCPRRQIQHQHVEPSPIHLVQQLLKSFDNHHATPRDRGFLRNEIAHRHRFYAVIRKRDKVVLCS